MCMCFFSGAHDTGLCGAVTRAGKREVRRTAGTGAHHLLPQTTQSAPGLRLDERRTTTWVRVN